MAFATKYEIYFADFDALPYRVSIQFEDYNSQVYELQGAPNPCIIQYGNADNKFKASNGSGCILNFYGRNDINMSDLFAIGIYSIKVLVEAYDNSRGGAWFLIWSGWANPELYSEDYTWKEGAMTLTANDGFGAMDKEKFFSGDDVNADGTVKQPWAKPFISMASIFTKLFEHVQFSQYYLLFETVRQGGTNISINYDTSNFIDEDGESMTKREVLDAILTPLTLRCFAFGDNLWIFDPCVLALNQAQVTFDVYSKSWMPATDYVYTKSANFDISDIVNRSIYFVGGSQRLNIIGGHKTFASVYSAYPAASKIVPMAAEDIPITEPDDTNLWTSELYTPFEENASYYKYRKLSPPSPETNFTNWGLTLGTGGMRGNLIQYGTDDNDTDTEAPDSFNQYVAITPQALTPQPDPNIPAFTITGGFLAKSSDAINIMFKSLFICTYLTQGEEVNKVEIKFTLRVGTYYAIYSYKFKFEGWTTTRTINTVAINAGFDADGNMVDIFNIETDVIIQFKDTPEYGQFVFEMMEYLVAKKGVSNALVNCNNRLLYFNASEILVNGRTINEDDLQYKAESDIDFTEEYEADIVQSSRRINGVLDRGCMLSPTNEQITNFTRATSPLPQVGSIGKTMAQGYLANYSFPTREITATIMCEQLLRNMAAITEPADIGFKDISRVATPVMVVKDSSFLGNTMLMFMGGSFNLESKELTGTWQEIHDSNYQITEA